MASSFSWRGPGSAGSGSRCCRVSRRSADLEITLLDRGGCPDIEGVITRVPFPSYTMSYTAADSLLIQKVCDRPRASTSSAPPIIPLPVTTPQVQIVYDMIPEVMEFDLSARAWKEKQLTLSYASYFACISSNTRHDLLHFYPGISRYHVRDGDQLRCRCGRVQRRSGGPWAHGLQGRSRHWRQTISSSLARESKISGYKNARLFFDAIKIDKTARYDVVCVGGEPTVNPQWARDLPRGVRVIRVDLSDAELATAYAGALALVYPSLYEGFGMPVVEAMASGCPVITTQHGSLGEVGGEAALVISGQDRYQLLRALERVQSPKTRRDLIVAGVEQAAKFDWDTTATQVHELLRRADADRHDEGMIEFHRRWKKLRTAQAEVDVGID